MRPRTLLALTGATACSTSAAESAKTTSRTSAAAATGAADSAPAAAATAPAARLDSTTIVRALCVNRFAAQSTTKMTKLIAVADSTAINAFVIDPKDEYGLNYNSAHPELARDAGSMGKIRDMKALLDTLKAHNILAIARIVVLKDSVTARNNPAWTIRKADGSGWCDHEGLPW